MNVLKQHHSLHVAGQQSDVITISHIVGSFPFTKFTDDLLATFC